MRNFSIMECAALPWDESSASSGLLYPRDAILDMTGPIAAITPFAKMHNLVIVYDLHEGSSSVEYDQEIRTVGMKISDYIAEIVAQTKADQEAVFSIDEINPDLPNVVFAWNCQSQGPYASTFLYGHPIDNLVPTILHPNEVLDGCVVSGNYVWPAFKVPTYLQTDHPILLELYRQHGKTLNFRGVIFGRSHNPSHWHKQRCAAHAVMLAKEYLHADGLIMAWEGGGNAAVDGMLTIQYAEQQGIKCTGVTFEFGGVDGREGVLMVDDVPEATAMISGGSIEKTYTLPVMDRAVGGKTMRLNKESGGYFPDATSSVTFDTTTHFYLGGNQCAASTLFAEAY